MSRSRMLEAEDDSKRHHGKFFIVQFDAKDRGFQSEINGGQRLLESLPRVRRFDGPITPSTLTVLDLQTQEAMMFDPERTEKEIRRRFLVHPIHVCILYFPLLLHLHRHRHEIWNLPGRVVLKFSEVVEQPGVLVDARGQLVDRMEWARREPMATRLRNREVSIEEDGQGFLTEAEKAEWTKSGKRTPVW